jgi:hypothetical protein
MQDTPVSFRECWSTTGARDWPTRHLSRQEIATAGSAAMDRAVVVNLSEVRGACRRVARWYGEVFAGRDPGPVALEDALAAVRALPPLHGRLGRALSALADPPVDVRDDELLAALRCVRQAAGELPGQLAFPDC